MRVGIAGLGLIGGSLALALASRHEVVGYARSAAVRELASARGIRAVSSLSELLPADVVVVATPLAAVVPTLRALAEDRRAEGTVLLDVGSLKREVAAYAEQAPAGRRIVGGHPMAGTTERGFAAADATLFRDRPFFLVPTARSDDAAMGTAGDLAREAGAIPTVVSATEHDRIVAVLSALPLVVARAVAQVGADVARFAGPGYRDVTRLAATPPELAEAILHGNAAEVRVALARLRVALAEIEAELF